MPLSETEYEDAYAEALFCLTEVGHAVGKPVFTNRVRHCSVDQRKLNDKDVLELWWGKDTAKKILRGRTHR